MPSLRLTLLFLAAVGIPTFLTFVTLLRAHPPHAFTAEGSDSSQGSFRTFFSFHTPSTLFPPSAIISLTDDNSTFFLARPADFGPSLASNGLSGQLWVGNGFGVSGHINEEGLGEGELGCSDVPGWDESSRKSPSQLPTVDAGSPAQSGSESKNERVKESEQGASQTMMESASRSRLEDSEPSEDDGTDDHLHHPLPTSFVSKQPGPGQAADHERNTNKHKPTHADIQSLQESAEISGKVALLSRGGCGFLEKVKWAQRRGAVALIVGDHTRGGALVTMYARGDTSNVSIPSVFTSHTTAHLLASLLPPESFAWDNEGTTVEKAGSRSNSRRPVSYKDVDNDRTTFTAASTPKSTSFASTKLRSSKTKSRLMQVSVEESRQGWFRSMFGLSSSSSSSEQTVDRTRPPSSGRIDWLSPKWSEKASGDNTEIASKKKDSKTSPVEHPAQDLRKPKSFVKPSDDFVIGVQDWRDPDLVISKSSSSKVSTSTSKLPASTPSTLSKSTKEEDSGRHSDILLSGGSITPGSGEYSEPDQDGKGSANQDDFAAEKHQSQHEAASGASSKLNAQQFTDEEHEGLWITLTPTTMSSSPFFDTLLVLVVSPLVTLTVVYALLLLRSRIRRRRWRAPRSLVDRLPIRTYHTMSCSSTASSTRSSTPSGQSPGSPHSQSSRGLLARARPRSATATGVGEAASISTERHTRKTPGAERAQFLGKKKYTGKSVECVVCLEEYVDGKSQVMSLPCGHEFHAECITPWLTTRRRTCPICKGDVVRSMSHLSSPNDTPQSQSALVTPDNVQEQAAETNNPAPTAAIPIPIHNDDEGADEEDLAATLVNDQPASASSSGQQGVWRGLANMSLSAFSGEAVWREARQDRSR